MRTVYLGPGEVAVYVAAGDDWDLPIFWFLNTDEVGNEIDITDFTFIAQLRRTVGSEDEIELTVNTDDAVNGLIRVTLPRADTDELAGCYRWGIRGTHPTAGRHQILKGPWTVERPVPR